MPVKKDETKPSTTRGRKSATTTAKKTTTRKTSTKAATSTSNLEKKVAANARHIDENHKTIENNSKLIHIMYAIIIILLVVIAGLAFYVGQMMGGNASGGNNNQNITPQTEEISIRVIDDARCTDCSTNEIVTQLQALPFLSQAEFTVEDFSDAGVADYLSENSISALPVIIFNTNALFDGGQVTPFLSALADGNFNLEIGATFDPFEERSERGFRILNSDLLGAIQADAYYKGSPDTELTWIEYTDVNCSFCQRMESDGTANTILEQFDGQINKTSSNFIGVGGQATQTAAELLECIGQEVGADGYNGVLSAILLSGDNSKDAILAYEDEFSFNASTIEACLDNGDTKDIVERKFAFGRENFGITGTPGNVILNTRSGEYEIISGAYPVETFQEVINRMLSE